MTTETVEQAGTSNVLAARPVGGGIIEAWESQIEAIPDAGGAGIEGVLAVIASATTAEELDAAWRKNGLERFVNVPIVVTDIGKMPSDFDDSPLPWYLMVQGAVEATGETFVASTGSVNEVAQLVQAYHRGMLPLRCTPRQKDSKRVKGNTFRYLETSGQQAKGGR